MNDSRGMSVDARIAVLLARRYPGAQLDALGKSFFSNIGKALKKVAPIALGAAALYFGGPIAAKAVSKIGSKGGGGAPKAPTASKVGKAVKGVGKAVGRVAKSAAQAAASQAIAGGAIPLQPGALRSNEELLATAVQIARSELAQQGVNMNSSEAQGIVRQAVQEAGQVPPADGFDWKKALPWVAGGGLVLVAVMMGARRPR